jgi:hypothetical protein
VSADVADTYDTGVPKLDPVVANVREVLSMLHDAPQRLVEAVRGDDHEEVLSIVGTLYCAIEHLREIYYDRVERFIDRWRSNDGIRARIEVIGKLNELAARTKREVEQ